MKTFALLALLLPAVASADPGAANACPPIGFLNATNYAQNASFETVGPNGSNVFWQNGQPTPVPAASASWFMHSSNAGAPVQSQIVPTNVPGPGGARMLRFVAGGNEGGVYQMVPNPPAKMMFSVWVKVMRGHVAVQAHGGNMGPVAWSTKRGEWEQLRVCTDGSVPTNMLVIYNQDPAGGEFYVDRVEARAIP
jgi:hypothetical protein